MIVICDCGSTKADWMFVESTEEHRIYETKGFNPYFQNEEWIINELKINLTSQVDVSLVQQVHFYGAGCSDIERCAVVQYALNVIFSNAKVVVDHDLLAAARALCGHEPGVAVIIGTGSNTCLYDGRYIIDNVFNLGYLLGDEGSGSNLGKSLLKSFFYREMPADLEEAFITLYGSDKKEILDKVYRESANVYLASYAKFIADHKYHIFVKKLVMDAFEELIKRHILKYDGVNRLPVHFVGSIAFHFSDILQLTLDQYNLTMGKVIKKPIDDLKLFHLNNPS